MKRGVVCAPMLLCAVCGYALEYLWRGFRPPEWSGRAQCRRCDVVYTLSLPVIECAMESILPVRPELQTEEQAHV